MGKTNVKADRSKWLTNLTVFLLMLVFSIQMIVPAHAYTLVYIQTSIDIATWEIIAVAVRDEIGISSASNETRRVEKDALSTMKSNQTTAGGANLTLISGLESDIADRKKSLADGGNFMAGLVQNIGWFEESNRVLSFPTDQTRRDSSTSVDFNNAMEVVNDISFDLNQAFSLYLEKNNIAKTPDASAFFTNMKAFLTNIGSSMNSDGTVTFEGMDFKWYTEKGRGSGEYINWYMLVYEAFNNYALEGDEAVTSDNVYTSTPNQLTKAIVGLFGEMLDGLRGILGLWSMDELLFSTGWRAKGYVGGIFPTSWEPYVWTLFTFMEIFAAMILLYGVINNVVKKAMSTINTIARMHFMAQLQDLLVCALALALLPVILRVVISLCSSFTGIIYNLVPDNIATGEKRTIAESVARYGSGSGSIGGIIAQFMFFGVQVSFNFMYAMRAMAVAILIIISPVMIAMISVSNARKQVTVQWAKELLAQICIQPIHAFVMAVILLLPTSSHGFDNIIALYALIPFTSVLKGFFFGSAGSWAEQASQKASKRMTGTMAAGAVGIAGVAAGGIAMAVGGSNNGGNNSSGNNNGNSDGGNSSDDASGEGDSSSNPDSTSLSAPKSSEKKPLGERLVDKAQEKRMEAYAAEDKYHDTGWIDDQVHASAASLGATALGKAAQFANSGVGQKIGAAGKKIANSPVGRVAGTAAGIVGDAAGFVGGELGQTQPMQSLRRIAKAVGGKVNNSNTAQALRDAKATIGENKLDRAYNVVKGVGEDAWNVGKAVTGTALKAGTGMAIGVAGGVMGGPAGRQLINMGSGMMAPKSASNQGENEGDESSELPAPDSDLNVRQDQGSSNELKPTQSEPALTDAVSDPQIFAAEYEQLVAQSGAQDNPAIDYEYGKEELASLGVSDVHYNRDAKAMEARFDFSTMNAIDAANARQMVSIWQNGTGAERAYMEQAGIKSVTPVVKTVNGQRQITGMRMAMDSKAYKQNFGVEFNMSKEATAAGRNLTISAPAKTTPTMVPNISQHMAAASAAAPSGALAQNVSPLRAAMTHTPASEPAPAQPIEVDMGASPVSNAAVPSSAPSESISINIDQPDAENPPRAAASSVPELASQPSAETGSEEDLLADIQEFLEQNDRDLPG